MKRLSIFAALVAAITVSSCVYDDTKLWTMVNNHENRIIALEELCKQLNTNVSALQDIIEVWQSGDYITSVTPIIEGSDVIGYTITFAKHDPITIYHGGAGVSGAAPIIGVRMDGDGIYYWTLNGEWLLDDNGNKIKAVGEDGKDGADGKDGVDGEDGKDGADGITPQLKIEDGYWYISYDNGATWNVVGKAAGEDGADGKDGDSFFESVVYDKVEKKVTFTLIDGTSFTIGFISPLDIVFHAKDVACYASASVDVSYTITGGNEDDIEIECWGNGGWGATVAKDSRTEGKIIVTAPERGGSGKIVVLATSGSSNFIMKSLHFEEGILEDILEAYEVDWQASTLEVCLRTNVDYMVNIPAEAQSWLSVADTRAAVREETLTFTVAENPEDEPARSAVVEIVSPYGEVMQSFEIMQAIQPASDTIQFADKFVKKVCVEKFDTNGDGELSYKEAAKVELIDSRFFGDYTQAVKSFDELQYFVNLTSIGNGAFEHCSILTSVTIPNDVTWIGWLAFNGCSCLTNVTIPDSVTSIEYQAFSGCGSLTSVTIPNGVTSIGQSAFSGCSSLTSVTIPDSVVSIGSHAFDECSSLTSVTIPDSVVSIGNYAFSGCSSLTGVTIPESVVSIGDGAFGGCRSLTSVTIPDSVVSIGDDVFAWCSSLTNVTIPDSVTSIGGYAFAYCSSLTNVTIPDSVTSIRGRTFYSCSSLTNVTIPESVVSIGDGAFGGCRSLTSVTIPDSVVSIGGGAFSGCGLTSVYCKATTPPVGGGDMFDNNASDRKIYVPTESVEAYKAENGWSSYADAIVGYDF